MYRGKRTKSHVKSNRRGKKRVSAVMLSLLLLLIFTIGGTAAYLMAISVSVQNTFLPSEVTCTVKDSVVKENNQYVKKDIVVTNTGDVDAYLRVKLISYRVNSLGDVIGGTASVSYTPEEEPGWVKSATDGHYYYTKPVTSGKTPEIALATKGIILNQYELTYEGDVKTNPLGDFDGGNQVIAVVAEAVQAQGKDSNGKYAVENAWPVVSVNADGTLTVS